MHMHPSVLVTVTALVKTRPAEYSSRESESDYSFCHGPDFPEKLNSGLEGLSFGLLKSIFYTSHNY